MPAHPNNKQLWLLFMEKASFSKMTLLLCWLELSGQLASLRRVNPGMGDMKTPDFDDLLAAFDIPDIDAKEAIQSAPDETEAPHSVTTGARKMQLLQQQHQQQQDTGQERPDEVRASLPSSSSLPPGTSPLAAAGPPIGLTSPFFPPSKPVLPTPPHPLHSTQPFNGASKGGFQHTPMEEEDSDPDLGSPLVIQETPESPTEPSQRYKSDLTLPSSSLAPHQKPGDTPSGASMGVSLPQSGSTESTAQEDKHPEHVIEERDSPESPEPEAPKSTAHVASKRCSSPAVVSTPPSSELREPKEEEEEMEVGNGNGIDRVADGKGDAEKGENAKVGGEKMDVEYTKSKTPAADPNAALVASGAPSRPLKVRIKTIKTSTGVTRTVTRVASKGGVDKSGEHKLLSNKNAKNEAGQVTTSSQKVSALNSLPVSTLAASSVMLAAATKVQNKMAASEKAKVSATAVSITKSTALPATPSVTSTGKFSAGSGGISVRTSTNKTANGGSGTIITSSLQPSKPASIVNSTGAVISRSQSSLVEAFNKILNSKNLLPSYKPDLSAPPPPEWGLPLPSTGYRCLECGDAFALERSLARHYDRRSLRIEVTCNHCAKRLAFFNKCSLLLHAREHKERGLVMQCSHLVMRPVTVEQMIGQQDITPIGVSSSSTSSTSGPSTGTSPRKDSAPASAQPRQVRRAAGPQALMPLPCKKAESLQYNNFKCPECQTQCNNKAELVTHFQQIRATSNSTCSQCSPPMMLPNSCALSAHQRVHKHKAPHVCPECGGTARPATFQTHLEEACLHFARRIGYRCSSCQVVFGGLNSIKSHIQTAHCEVFHKCPSCPMAFKSAPSAQSHISTQHPNLSGGQAKMIYKCVMCDTVFTLKPLLYMHFDTHLAKQKVHVFKCPDCTKLYAQKGSMMEHIRTAHRGQLTKLEVQSETSSSAPAPSNAGASGLKSKSSAKTDNSDGEDWGRDQEEDEEDEEDDDDADEDYEAPGSQTVSANQTEWTCPQCQTTFTDHNDFLSHVKMEHGKFPCRICGGSFSTSSSLRRHERVIHEGNKRVFRCQFCTEGKRTFGSRFLLDKHIRLYHRNSDGQAPPMTRKRAATGVDGSSSELEGEGASAPRPGPEEEDHRSEDGEEGAAPAKRTRTSAAPAPTATAAAADPEEDDSVFRCVPCGFTTEDGAEFQQHIPQHRADTASFQCLQCGVCFASAGSLGRHRFITHRVRDTHSSGGGGGEVPSAGSQRAHHSPDGSPAASPGALGEELEGNQTCRVCGRRFDKASDLNTHFRTHGMAFLTAHKTDKP
uniref:C2H2-type domain-containing protein n=1 Tax=Knipowitschia caucasica TaxID=637954 RepID=A0AAV2K4K8_KNICA